MTSNEVAYWTLQEQKRAALVDEAERNRANLAKEQENQRANMAKEQENYRSNKAKETETHRANVASENIGTGNSVFSSFGNIGSLLKGISSFLK